MGEDPEKWVTSCILLDESTDSWGQYGIKAFLQEIYGRQLFQDFVR